MMEKFCIVKRRKQYPVPPGEAARPFADTGPQLNNVTALSSYAGAAAMRQDASRVEIAPAPGNGEQLIRIFLSPDQCRVARENIGVKDLLGRTIGKVSLDIQEAEEGQIVFNLHLKQVFGTKTLSMKEVCDVLQASKSFVVRLVRHGKIKSYKIGRLRRFLLEDVLEYLTRGDEVVELLKGSSKTAGAETQNPGEQPAG